MRKLLLLLNLVIINMMANASDYYLIGTFNGWKGMDPSCKFTRISNDLYMLDYEGDFFDSNYEMNDFRIYTGTWDEPSFGSSYQGEIGLNVPFGLDPSPGPGFYNLCIKEKISNPHFVLNFSEMTLLITKNNEDLSDILSTDDVIKSWGSKKNDIIEAQEGGYKIKNQEESIIVFSKDINNKFEAYISYKFDKLGKLCAATLSFPENEETKKFSDQIFSQYDSEITVEDGLEVKTDESNLMAVDVSSTVNGNNIITIGFSYYEPIEERDDCVDLGLSVRWATMNLGASKPTGVGGFYAFSETSTKSEYWRRIILIATITRTNIYLTIQILKPISAVQNMML